MGESGEAWNHIQQAACRKLIPSSSSKKRETKCRACVLLVMKMKMKALVFFLGAIPTLAMTGCEMDMEEMDEAELAELDSYEATGGLDMDVIDLDSLPADAEPDMQVAAMLPGVKCNEVFSFINDGPPPGHLATMSYSYQQPSAGAGELVQGKMGHWPITAGVRGQGTNVQNQGFSGAAEVRIDLVKNYFGRTQLSSSVQMKLVSNVSYLVNKNFTTKGCNDYGNHATVYADSSDGSQLMLTYQWLFPGG